MPVTPKTQEEIEGMRVAGRLAADVLEMIEPLIEVGMTTRRDRQDLPRLHRRGSASDPRTAELSRVPQIDLHLR